MWIYKITNLVNNKIYIGQTTRSVEDRWRDHCTLTKSKHKSLIRLAVAKYGKQSFKIETIDQCFSIEELNWKEKERIEEFNSLSPNGYNLDNGGKGKTVHSLSKLKMSLAKIGRPNPHTDQSKAKLSAIKKGIKLNENHKISLSKARKDKKPVKCIQNNIVYESFSAAAKALNIPVQRVSQCANGKRKSAYGYTFEVICEQ